MAFAVRFDEIVSGSEIAAPIHEAAEIQLDARSQGVDAAREEDTERKKPTTMEVG